MKKKDLQRLAQKIQLEMTEEELNSHLVNFEQLEKSLIDFKKIKISKKFKPMERIDTGCLNLTDLEKVKKHFSQQEISKKILENNSEITEDGFILFKKILKI